MQIAQNILILFVITLIISACNTLPNRESNEEYPNIIVILADDMGYGDVGCYNSKSKIPSPNMDNLASEGIRFTDAHSPSSVCTPSRYGFLTGRYCWRTRLKKGVILGYDETPLIEKDRMTLASLLSQKGYHSACVGKWHLGLNWQTKNGYVLQNDLNYWKEYTGVSKLNEENVDFTKPISGGPRDLGFDYFFGTFGCSTGDPPYCFIENNQTIGIPSVLSPDEMNQHPGVVKGLMVPDWSQEDVDIKFTQKASEFIDHNQKENTKNPFFLYLALSSPHIPFLPPEFAKGKSEEGGRGDLVTVVDWSVGEIMKTLDRHKISNNTLLIVTSDNGPRKGANGHLSAGNFKGYKGKIWEGGHRVPFIARWPNKISPGTISDEVISLTDMYATFAAIVELDFKNEEGRGEDSHNVLPAFYSKNLVNADDQVRVFHSASGSFAIRKGKWKLIEKRVDENKALKIDPSLNSKGELYDLSVDPFEKNNIWEKNPDVVLEMTQLLSLCKKSKSVASL